MTLSNVMMSILRLGVAMLNALKLSVAVLMVHMRYDVILSSLIASVV